MYIQRLICLRDVGLDFLRNGAAADGTLVDRGRALLAADQVTTRDEHHAEVSVHADLTLLLSLQLLQLFHWILISLSSH